MEQRERIEYMERILDDAGEAAEALLCALERYRAMKPRLAELEAYYASAQWMRDYEDDTDGKLPAELKRGVLSEDAVFDLLHMCSEIDKALEK